MRTGDLGFFDDEKNLFITGRIKELIIIRGQNYYPQDLEETAEQACEQLRPSCGGAFSIDHKNEEVLVLVYELKRKYSKTANHDEIRFVIKDTFAKKYGLTIHDIVLIETSSFPKTSSGKLQRRLAKQMYLNKQLKTI
jgi:acyl-CoA synthetase (AMP-forming)/AMP-acid ligase II